MTKRLTWQELWIWTWTLAQTPLTTSNVLCLVTEFCCSDIRLSSAIANQESLSSLETEMRKLEGVVKEIYDEMEYLKKREARFTSTNSSYPPLHHSAILRLTFSTHSLNEHSCAELCLVLHSFFGCSWCMANSASALIVQAQVPHRLSFVVSTVLSCFDLNNLILFSFWVGPGAAIPSKTSVHNQFQFVLSFRINALSVVPHMMS